MLTLIFTVLSIYASTGQCLDCIRSLFYVFNPSIACWRFLDPANKVATGESVDVTLHLQNKFHLLKIKIQSLGFK